jgi:hypothetical protein
MGVNDKVQGKTDITTTNGLTEIGILLYPRAQRSAVLGLTDLFGVANRLSAEHADFHKRPPPRESGKKNFCMSSERKTQPARMRISKTAFAARSPQIVSVFTGIGR